MTPDIFETYAGLEGAALLSAVLRDFQGRGAVVSSFGAESAVLLHMVAQVDAGTPVIFLDTGRHFWETISHRSKLIDHLGLSDVRTITPSPQALQQQDPTGELHAQDPDRCCRIRKVEPLQHALSGFDVVVSGRKRYHGATRATLDFLSIAEGRLRVEPLAGFSALDIKAYFTAQELPPHPLTELGYFSIGCEPCTQPGGSQAAPRAGRWAGSAKTECGIHWTLNGQAIISPERHQGIGRST